MGIVQINNNPTRRQLNQFGLVWLGFLILFGFIAYFKFHSSIAAEVLWVFALLVPAIGWVAPTFMKLVYLGLSYISWPIGFVVSHVILAFVYYFVITPVGLALRIFGYDSMQRKFDQETKSYWQKREHQPEAKNYFRQY